MSGTLAALTSAPVKTPELRHQYERLIMRLEDSYFRAMLTYLALGDWADVLEEEHIPLRERLAIALQFLEDDALSAYRVRDTAPTELRRSDGRRADRGDPGRVRASASAQGRSGRAVAGRVP